MRLRSRQADADLEILRLRGGPDRALLGTRLFPPYSAAARLGRRAAAPGRGARMAAADELRLYLGAALADLDAQPRAQAFRLAFGGGRTALCGFAALGRALLLAARSPLAALSLFSGLSALAVGLFALSAAGRPSFSAIKSSASESVTASGEIDFGIVALTLPQLT